MYTSGKIPLMYDLGKEKKYTSGKIPLMHDLGKEKKYTSGKLPLMHSGGRSKKPHKRKKCAGVMHQRIYFL